MWLVGLRPISAEDCSSSQFCPGSSTIRYWYLMLLLLCKMQTWLYQPITVVLLAGFLNYNTTQHIQVCTCLSHTAASTSCIINVFRLEHRSAFRFRYWLFSVTLIQKAGGGDGINGLSLTCQHQSSLLMTWHFYLRSTFNGLHSLNKLSMLLTKPLVTL